jgi:hypothetical protein
MDSEGIGTLGTGPIKGLSSKKRAEQVAADEAPTIALGDAEHATPEASDDERADR